MELKNSSFQDRVRTVFVSDLPVLATVPIRGSNFTEGLKQRSDVRLIEVTRNNRDELPEEIIPVLV